LVGPGWGDQFTHGFIFRFLGLVNDGWNIGAGGAGKGEVVTKHGPTASISWRLERVTWFTAFLLGREDGGLRHACAWSFGN